jgi:hypothetical protein
MMDKLRDAAIDVKPEQDFIQPLTFELEQLTADLYEVRYAVIPKGYAA